MIDYKIKYKANLKTRTVSGISVLRETVDFIWRVGRPTKPISKNKKEYKFFDKEIDAWRWLQRNEQKEINILNRKKQTIQKRIDAISEVIRTLSVAELPHPTSAEVLLKIRTIISHKLACDIETVTLDKHLVNDLGADSLDMVEITMEFEDEFDIEIPDDVSEKLFIIKDIFTYLCMRLVLQD